MRTVILAGGEGTRLRPLTCDTPKPLASLCGKPILEYLFDGLLRSGIDRAILTLGYLPGKIQEKYADGYNNLALEFVREDEPLGTAGGMRNAIPDCRDSVFVLSGDALCDYDFARIIANHRRSNASVTIVGTQVNDPREYGLLRTDERNFVTGFVEKPAWSQAVGGIANTGIYILEPDALEEIPVGEKFDFAKDLFPKLIKAGKQINCCRAFGYWCDVGDISTFMQAARDILDRRLDIPCPENEENGIFGSIPKGRYTIKPPVYFGKNVNIADGATVGPYTILEDDTQVGAGARVRLSVLMNAVRVGANCRVTGSLLCDSAVVKRGAFLFEGSVLGSGAVGGEESAIQPGVRIWPGKEVGSGCCASENLQYGSRRRDLFGDDGLDGGAVLSPRFCAALGTAMASVPECRRAAVAHDGNPRSMALAAALVGGLQYGGASVWKLGECFLAQANYCGAFGGRNFTLFVRENKITAAGEGGLPLPRYTERAIEAAWENSAETAAPVKMAADMSNLRGAYTQEIRNQAGRENQRERPLAGITVNVLGTNPLPREVLKAALCSVGASVAGGKITLRLNADGTRMSAFTEVTGQIPFEKLLAICCLEEFREGRIISLCSDAPFFLENLARENGGKLMRYMSCPSDTCDAAPRRAAMTTPWTRDALLLSARLLGIMARRGASLGELLAQLPAVHIMQDFASTENGLDNDCLTRLCGSGGFEKAPAQEGFMLRKGLAKLLIIPGKNGRKMRLLAEAASMEAAAALCGEVRGQLSIE